MWHLIDFNCKQPIARAHRTKLRCMARSLLAAASFAMPFSSKTSTKASKTCDGIGCERPHTKIIAPASWAKSSTACMDLVYHPFTAISWIIMRIPAPRWKLAQLSQLFTKMSKVSKQKPPATGSHHPMIVLCSDSVIRVNRTNQTHSHSKIPKVQKETKSYSIYIYYIHMFYSNYI